MPTVDEGAILDLGKTPIAGAAPTGVDAADDPDYILVNAEMTKADRVDTGPPEWHEMERAATDVLRLKSKDVEMACCLGLAMFRRYGYAGFSAALGMIGELLNNFWDGLFPERHRRRKNTIESLCERFTDGGWFADDSIQLISTDMYRRQVLPWHRLYLAQWSVAGPHAIHLCGDAARHFPTIRDELRVMSFDTGFPVDHGALRKALGPDVEILGGPEVALLLRGSPQDIYERTRGILQSGVMAGGRFVLREANNLPPGCPQANLEAMYRAALDFGWYR